MPATEEITTDVVQLHQDLANLRSDLSSLMTTIKDLSVEQGRVMQTRVREAGQQAREQAVAARQNMQQYIEARPISSVLVALGTGFVIGTALSRRH